MRTTLLKLLILLSCFMTMGQADLIDDATPYILPQNHSFHAVLDRIFASSKTLDSKTDLIKAGFTIIDLRDPMFVIAAHPALPGHLIKVYLHSSNRSILNRWNNLITRCNAAERLRNLIYEKNLKYFIVPDKWIYVTPTENQDPVLIVTRINIVSEQQTKYAWKHIAKRKHIKELYCIISNDCGSSKLKENIPYTKEGVFACIDTEKPSQGDRHLKKYLSEKMKEYWDYLVKSDKNRKKP